MILRLPEAVCIALLSVAAACGGNPAAIPPPATPPAAAFRPTASAPAAGSSHPEGEGDPSATAKPTVNTTPAVSADDSLKPTQKPQEIIGATDVIFLLAFDNSDAGKAADKKCSAVPGQEPSQVAACIEAARDKIQANAVRFTRDVSKNWWFSSMQKKGNNLVILHKVMFDFGDETDRSIVIKLKGKDQGVTPWALLPKEVRVEVLNDFTIALLDPQLGKLLYEAKVGIGR
jgi:hypothetical protein